jgi:hypothetical protein
MVRDYLYKYVLAATNEPGPPDSRDFTITFWGLLWTSNDPDERTSTWQHTQHSQETDVYAPAEIRTHNQKTSSRRSTALHLAATESALVRKIAKHSVNKVVSGKVLFYRAKKWATYWVTEWEEEWASEVDTSPHSSTKASNTITALK